MTSIAADVQTYYDRQYNARLSVQDVGLVLGNTVRRACPYWLGRCA